MRWRGTRRPSACARLSAQIGQAVDRAKAALAGAQPAAAPEGEETDPERRLEQAFQQLLGVTAPKEAKVVGPTLVVAVGDVDVGKTLNLLEGSLGTMQPAPRARTPKLKLRRKELRAQLDHPIAQAQLGYVVPAPAPSARDGLAWRLLLYVLTHGYEGRLGKEAISRRGLVYYIDGQYRSDGERAFVSLAMGVDPAELAPMEALLREQVALLAPAVPRAPRNWKKRSAICWAGARAQRRATRRSQRAWRRNGCGTAVCFSPASWSKRWPRSRRAIWRGSRRTSRVAPTLSYRIEGVSEARYGCCSRPRRRALDISRQAGAGISVHIDSPRRVHDRFAVAATVDGAALALQACRNTNKRPSSAFRGATDHEQHTHSTLRVIAAPMRRRSGTRRTRAGAARLAYVLFEAGGFLGYTYNKWGDDHSPGTGAVVYWSYMPAGTPGSDYCGDACTGISTTTMNYYDHERRAGRPSSCAIGERHTPGPRHLVGGREHHIHRAHRR